MRTYTGKTHIVITVLMILWVVFQLWFSTFGIMASASLRASHCLFLLLFAFLLYPARKNGESNLTRPAEGPLTNGLSIIKKLITQSCKHLAQNGTILMETGEYNAQATADFAQEAGFATEIHRDLEGQMRVVEMRLSGHPSTGSGTASRNWGP